MTTIQDFSEVLIPSKIVLNLFDMTTIQDVRQLSSGSS